jgi:hypothetical protein
MGFIVSDLIPTRIRLWGGITFRAVSICRRRLLHKQEPLSEKQELMRIAQCLVLKITEGVD